MSDLFIAGLVFVLLIGLALAAPNFGVDSRDDINRDEHEHRARWFGGA
ncbi:MAG: hypothetical protein IT305_07460 [Chloroflexi bacterium]|nr:hypothetical protein [Chloroflexota bacterium]